MPEGYDNRVVLDEDVPAMLTAALNARGIRAVHVNALRERILATREAPHGGSITDTEVCQEVAREPSVLVTLNIRDYADPAMMRELVLEHRVSVVIVRVPKRESGAGRRPAAIADIVHRNVPKVVMLYGEPATISTATRRGLRTRSIDEIETQWG